MVYPDNSNSGARSDSGWARQTGTYQSKSKKPTQYDGKSGCKDYLVQFEMIAEMNGWGLGTKAMELATSLKGQAQEILTCLEPANRRSYDHLVQALLDRFEPENQTEVYRAQLKGRQRRKTESLPELAQEIGKLVRKAYPHAPPAVRETLARDSFIDSLGSADMEWNVFQGKPSNLGQALKLAVEFDAFQAGRSRRLGNNPVVRMQTLTVEPDRCDSPKVTSQTSIEDKLGEILGRLARIESSKDKPRKEGKRSGKSPKRGKCFYCEKQGHFIGECETRLNDVKARMANQTNREVAPKPMSSGSGNA